MPPARSSTRSSGPLTRSKSGSSLCRSTNSKATRSLDALTSEQNAFLVSLNSNNRRATGKRKGKKKCGGRLAKTNTDPADEAKDTLSAFTVEYLHGLRHILPRSACASLQPSGSAGPSSPSCPAPPHGIPGAPPPYTQYKEHKKPPPTLVIPGPSMWFVPTLMPVAFVPQPAPSRLDWESELELHSESEPESAEDDSEGEDSADSYDIQVDSKPINISDLEPRPIETTAHLDIENSRVSCVPRGCGDDGLAAKSPAASNCDEVTVELPHWDPDVDATVPKATNEVKVDNSEARSIDTIPNPSEPANEPRDSALPRDDGVQPATAIEPEMVPENLLQELEVSEPQDPWGWDWNVQEARATLASATDEWWDEAAGLWSGSGPFWDDPGAHEPPGSGLDDEPPQQLREGFGFGHSELDPALRDFVDLFPAESPMFENVEWR
ncbi:hypothetical protein HMN09_00889300 [Mycena chlorophos]|uniref:Uncharacterized protein n=1 Tax=Mycena chlorophos TaxID=658473 RepID=A0A8H6SMW0_MYCCL|nr:hypothetical protein HMN09_00889300 [Mycena chlorophos]